jgi:predicted rRNA methylase YqxC with S4 and FtsJ domains
LSRELLHSFELWAKKYFAIIAKADSEVAGTKGNRERFYLLKPTR